MSANSELLHLQQFLGRCRHKDSRPFLHSDKVNGQKGKGKSQVVGLRPWIKLRSQTCRESGAYRSVLTLAGRPQVQRADSVLPSRLCRWAQLLTWRKRRASPEEIQ